MPSHGKTASRSFNAYDVLPPEPRSRRQSGGQIGQALQVEDAIFEVVPQRTVPLRQSNDNPPPVRKNTAPGRRAVLSEPAGRIALGIERHLARLSPQAFMMLVTLLFVAVFSVCGGFSSFSQRRAAAGPTQPFSISDVTVAAEDANGMRVVSVSGMLVNVSPEVQPAPRLTVVGGSLRRPLGSLTLPVGTLPSGTAIRFSGRFNLAGGKAGDIAVIAGQP